MGHDDLVIGRAIGALIITIKSRDRTNAEALSTYLRSRPQVVEFRITPTGG